MRLDPFLMLAVIIILGAVAQWLGWLLRLPSILLLLFFGFLAGPVAGVVRPDELFGPLLQPFVAISVAMILFEGGLSLNVAELRRVGGALLALVTLGALVTWALAAVAAYWLIGLSLDLSILLGAILTVTGPTVVLPLLQHIRPVGSVNAILKWEGIIIDPIGAVLAVIAFEIVSEGRYENAASHAALSAGQTLLIGSALGLMGAAGLALAIRRFWVPDHLLTLIAAMVVIGVFAGSNLLQHESGLMAVTAMGIALANQRFVDIRHILAFKENLRVFLLSTVFVLLSARLQLGDLKSVGLGTVAFIVVLILVVRPASVFASTLGSGLVWRERAFLAWMAPRGIVAAAVTSVFALALEERGLAQARLLPPIVFSTIVGTVLVYGLTSGRVARFLGLADTNPQGLLIVGAAYFAREIALAVKSCGVRLLLVDTNRDNIASARMAGLNIHFGSILAEDTLQKIDLAGIGRVLAMTSNDEVNTLATQRFAHIFGRAGLFQIPPKGSESGKSGIDSHLHGRLLFRTDATFARLSAMVDAGAVVRTTKLSSEFNYAAFRAHHGDAALTLFVVNEAGRLSPIVCNEKLDPQPGQTIISLVHPTETRAKEITSGAPSSAAASSEGGTGSFP